MSAGEVVLLLTVGGSPQPLRTAIRALGPRFVGFVCSDGSLGEAETLAAEFALGDDAFAMLTVAADDPDDAGPRCRAFVEDLRRRFPDARLRLDYTGGTKTMSAALMLAGIREPEAKVELQLTTGERADLRQVTDGTERATRIEVDALLAERTLETAGRFWHGFGYSEAEALLERPATDLAHAESVPAALRARLIRAHRRSALFAAWDRFDHATARRLAAELDAPLAPAHDRALDVLARRQEPSALLVVDLWRNACRRAARGQYEDAVARCYRAAEATAQWLLREHAGVDTGNVDPQKLPGPLHERLRRQRGRHDRYKLTLGTAWDLLGGWVDQRDAPPAFRKAKGVLGRRVPALGMRTARQALDDPRSGWTARRNRSILGHGFEPVTRRDWEAVSVWMQEVIVGGILPTLGFEPDEIEPQLPTMLEDG